MKGFTFFTILCWFQYLKIFIENECYKDIFICLVSFIIFLMVCNVMFICSIVEQTPKKQKTDEPINHLID